MKSKYHLLLGRQKRNIKTYSIMCIVLALLVGAYSYMQYSKYSTYVTAIAVNEKSVENLGILTEEEEDEYELKKPEFNELQSNMEENLIEVYPMKEDYTALTRAFDTYESSTHRKNNPFVISNIDYQDVQQDDETNANYLPLRMSISSSLENFQNFMYYVENSGSLTDKTRLMDIQSIRLNFAEISEDEESGKEIINFSVKIHAYFQNI